MKDRAGSVREGLRAQHQAIVENTDPVYLDDPLHPGVVMRYRYVPLRKTEKFNKRFTKIKGAAQRATASAIETILLALDEIMVADPDGEIPTSESTGRELYPQPLSPLANDGEPPMRFDQRLCDVMGFPEGTADVAAKIVRSWYGPRGEYLLIEHAEEVASSFTEVADEVRDEFAGELGKA